MLEQHYSLIRSKNVLAILLFSKERTATNIKLLSYIILKFVDVIFLSPEMDLITCLSTVSGVYAKKKRALLSRSKLGLPETRESFVGKKRTSPRIRKTRTGTIKA